MPGRRSWDKQEYTYKIAYYSLRTCHRKLLEPHHPRQSGLHRNHIEEIHQAVGIPNSLRQGFSCMEKPSFSHRFTSPDMVIGSNRIFCS